MADERSLEQKRERKQFILFRDKVETNDQNLGGGRFQVNTKKSYNH